MDVLIPHLQTPLKYKPVSKEHQWESEVWSLHLGFPGKSQLGVLPGNVSGLPSILEYHPFQFINFHAQACIRQQTAQRSAVRVEHRCKEFHMDFGFMHASSHDYSQPSKATDRVVQSYDCHSSYLIIVDAAIHFIWVFLFTSKYPPMDIIGAFMQQFGLPEGGFVRTDQGG